MIELKTKDEIAIMKEGGQIAARILKLVKEKIKPGLLVKELDQMAEDEIIKAGAIPSFKNFKGYPASTCISVNEEVVHGIPSNRVLKAGDIAGVDVGVYYKGFHTDTSVTLGVGKITPEAQKLIDVTKASLEVAIELVKPGIHLGDIQAEIQKTIEKAGFSVIRDLVGHGVGRQLQEAPSIPNYGKKGEGIILKEGMTIAIEPMVAAGSWKVNVLQDGWTVVTADGSLSAHFEHTLAITKDGCEVLTKI